MSYARFGAESDVYVYRDSEWGFTCCACDLDPAEGDREDIYGRRFETRAELMAHMHRHAVAGDSVPAGLWGRLGRELWEEGDAMRAAIAFAMQSAKLAERLRPLGPRT